MFYSFYILIVLKMEQNIEDVHEEGIACGDNTQSLVLLTGTCRSLGVLEYIEMNALSCLTLG